MSFDEAEEQDGIRFSWNIWPSSRLDATRNLVVPLGCLYTPLRKNPQTPLVYYEPIHCKGSCHGVLNPFCTVDVRGKLWICPFCYQRNQFPPQYADITETNLPAELIPAYSTIEYALPMRQALPVVPPIFLFMVDTCLPEEDMQALKESLLMALTLLPENALMGLITFGSTVQIYELAFTECPKSFVFRGNKEVTAKQITDILALSRSGAKAQQPQQGGAQAAFRDNSFLVPLSECELNITSILEELQHDPRPVKSDKRPLRSTGVAISAAVSLLETTYPNSGARIMLFVGGPCTEGPGMVVGDELKELMRSYSDIVKDKAKYTGKATKFYEALAKRAVTNGHVVDIYGSSFDQYGLLEMRDLVHKTGGVVINSDCFDFPMFKQSFTHMLKNSTSLGYNASLEVLTSRELKVCGAIGPLASLSKSSASVAETEIGIGNTCAWKICGVDPSSTFAIYFEVVNAHTNPIPQGQNGIIQFTTQYQNHAGQKILRVTTVSRTWADTQQGIVPLAQGFDQEAAAVMMARMAIFKADNMEDSSDILRWLDRMLIRLVSKYANYRKDDPSSFSLAPNFSIYPQFMFHLRRSQFMQVFNSSPDESNFYRLVMHRETVSNSLIMIQPTLEAYSFSGPPVPVLLSATSVQADRILLLDAFFTVVIFSGDTVAQWRKDKYHENPQYANFAQLLQAPKDDAAMILKERFPHPRFVECDQGTSQARFLLAALDPAITHNTMSPSQGEVIFTDDVSLKGFMEHLKKLAVASQ
jgi:protein transport protein SEC23